MPGAYDRRRGTALIFKPEGILVVCQGNSEFLLPGGGAKQNESRIEAAIRELREETGLIAYDVRYLFAFHRSNIFLIKATGEPKPCHEISKIGYYREGSSIPISFNTKLIIERFWREYPDLSERTMK